MVRGNLFGRVGRTYELPTGLPVILVDAGLLVALVDADDQYHEQCVSTLKTLQEPLATVWPPLTEAMYLLNDLPAAQEALWEMLVRKALELLPLGLVDLPRIRELLRKYADRLQEPYRSVDHGTAVQRENLAAMIIDARRSSQRVSTTISVALVFVHISKSHPPGECHALVDCRRAAIYLRACRP